MDMQDDLDSDFLFYLDFTKTFINQLRDKDDKAKCRAWLAKLCGEPFRSIEEKRNRNILLSQLVLCMEDGRLKPPFTEVPDAVDLAQLNLSLGHTYQYEEEENLVDQTIPLTDFNTAEGDARTYLATRAMPGGEGAFAYFAITLSDEEPKWIGAGEGFDKKMEEKFKEMVPPLTEMEEILLKRKDPEERKRVLAFYDALLENIDNELDGNIIPGTNNTVNGLLAQLRHDLELKGNYDKYDKMRDDERRMELLTLLHERLYSRRLKVFKREQYLDSIEFNEVNASFFDTSIENEDKHVLPAAMWEQVINREPNKKNMKLLYETYPKSLISKFIQLLSDEKELIAKGRQQRHENMVTQMKKDLRKEATAAREPAEKAKESLAEILRIHKLVQEAYDRQQEQRKAVESRIKGGRTDQSEAYDQLRETLFDTQRDVEDEAERGKLLAKQINEINTRTEECQKVNDQSIRRVEDANMELMKKIKRLRCAVTQHEMRLKQVQMHGKQITANTGGTMFFA